jgi:hypothetical protein
MEFHEHPFSALKSSGLLPGVGFWCMTNLRDHLFVPSCPLKMGQTSDPETLVIHQKMTPGNNPGDFKQHLDHGGSLQLHPFSDFRVLICEWTE